MADDVLLDVNVVIALVWPQHVHPEALALLAGLRAHPRHRFVPDDTTLAAPVISLTRFATTRHVTDLHLVNLCAAHELVLLTLDRAIPEALEPGDRRFVSVLDEKV